MTSIKLLIVMAMLFQFVTGDGIFFVTPRPTTVFVNDIVHLECGMNEEGLLGFTYTPPKGPTFSDPIPIRKDLPNGGSKITATFIMTKELNTTTVVCFVAGTAHRSNPATIYAYALPSRVENMKLCQLDRFVFLSWDQIFAPVGIDVKYEINDNKGVRVTSDANYGFAYDEEMGSNYSVNITVIVNAANQTSSRNISNNLSSYKLNGM